MILGFWGLTVFPEKTYTQVVDNSFKLSMAALDEVTKPGRTSIRVTVDKKTFILCSLTPGKVEQQNLDLVFTEGEEITFSVSGDTAVHLSGNYLPEDDDGEYGDEDDMYGDLDEESDDDEDEDDSDENSTAIITKGAKRLAQFEMDSDDDEDSEEDPDFTGEDDEDEEDEDEDDEEENDVEGQDSEEEEDGEDDEDEEEEDEDDEEDEEAMFAAAEAELKEAELKEARKKEEAAKKDTAKKKQEANAAAAKKQKVSEDKAVTTKPKEEAPKKEETPKKKEEHKKTLPNGLTIEDVKAGEGARAKSGKKIGMRYIGRLANGKVFDKNTGGKPFSFSLGRGEVIKGWDLGIQGMQLGGERRLTIPPALAYGARGAPPDIPPNSTLVFEVKLVSLK
ncbi:peptidylprolyl isomerase fpr4 [Podila epicladia]|nr:peptidylprolyl isomerase fpr4 [Podila epicladia]